MVPSERTGVDYSASSNLPQHFFPSCARPQQVCVSIKVQCREKALACVSWWWWQFRACCLKVTCNLLNNLGARLRQRIRLIGERWKQRRINFWTIEHLPHYFLRLLCLSTTSIRINYRSGYSVGSKHSDPSISRMSASTRSPLSLSTHSQPVPPVSALHIHGHTQP